LHQTKKKKKKKKNKKKTKKKKKKKKNTCRINQGITEKHSQMLQVKKN